MDTKTIENAFTRFHKMCPNAEAQVKQVKQVKAQVLKKFGTMSSFLSQAASHADLVAKVRKEVACRPERLAHTLKVPDVQKAISTPAAFSRPMLTSWVLMGAANLDPSSQTMALETSAQSTRNAGGVDLVAPVMEEFEAMTAGWDPAMSPRVDLEPKWRELLFADHANNTLTRRMAKRFNAYALDLPEGDFDVTIGSEVFRALAIALANSGEVTWDNFADALCEELEKLDNSGVADTIPEPEDLEPLFN